MEREELEELDLVARERPGGSIVPGVRHELASKRKHWELGQADVMIPCGIIFGDDASLAVLLAAAPALALACLEAREIDPDHTGPAPDPLGDAIALIESVLDSLGDLVNDGFQGSQLAEDLESLSEALGKLAAQRIALRVQLDAALAAAGVEVQDGD